MLVLGATGTVGLIAALVAKSAGAQMLGLARDSQKNRDLLNQAGIRAIFDDGGGSVTSQLKEAAPQGITLVIDSLWGSYPDDLPAY
ncbi:hypothetical protein [Rothia aerolata]|uniref:hypothetical protein n=1 Tax=Rothia aerolata TaxID=1812262 RepID=UPI001665C8BB|nr:hypothetical protein [Rothia aerolata]